jgi:hypothetical protein
VIQSSKLKVQGKELTRNALKSIKTAEAGEKESKSKGRGKETTAKKTPKSAVQTTRSSPLCKKQKAVLS